jgi:hypothetical protein
VEVDHIVMVVVSFVIFYGNTLPIILLNPLYLLLSNRIYLINLHEEIFMNLCLVIFYEGMYELMLVLFMRCP